ncbi:MAG: transaldolase family protein, partial [Acidobacteriota bacterium]
NRTSWAPQIDAVLVQRLEPEPKAEALMRIVVTHTAEKLMPEFERTGGASGFVCGQVNPNRAGDRDSMLAMARRYAQWMPNIAVKLPATAAGMDVLEDCIAEGITVTSTVNFTVPQVITVAERHRQGIQRAAGNGVAPGKCFAVIMIGRLDDYLREIAHDSQAAVTESDIRQAGLAVTKRAYSIYKERGYEAVLLVAALRGTYHLTELAGADLVMSIAPAFQEPFVSREFPREERIDCEVPADVIARLGAMPEFVRAYEPGGMAPSQFLSYGLTQRTLSQFIEAGWRLIENFE